MQISKVTVVSLHHLFATLSKAKQQQIICLCAVKLQREPIHFKAGLLVKFMRCTFQCLGFNIMYNTEQPYALVSIYNEMKCNWLLGYKVKWASTGISQVPNPMNMAVRQPDRNAQNISCNMIKHHPLIFKSQLNFD